LKWSLESCALLGLETLKKRKILKKNILVFFFLNEAHHIKTIGELSIIFIIMKIISAKKIIFLINFNDRTTLVQSHEENA